MEQNWDGADLQQIVSQAMEAFAQSGRNRLRVEGPAVCVPPKGAFALAMALQDLATNASKYGAFSNDSGRANVSWVLRGSDPQWFPCGGSKVADRRSLRRLMRDLDRA